MKKMNLTSKLRWTLSLSLSQVKAVRSGILCRARSLLRAMPSLPWRSGSRGSQVRIASELSDVRGLNFCSIMVAFCNSPSSSFHASEFCFFFMFFVCVFVAVVFVLVVSVHFMWNFYCFLLRCSKIFPGI